MQEYDIKTLIRNAIDPDLVDQNPDIGLFLEIADRFNESNSDCKEGCLEINKFLKSKNRFKRWHSILLIECLVKNCKMRFHYELLGEGFCKTCLKIMAKRRKRKGLYFPLVSKTPLQKEIEGKLLYLIQLWADTFMMHQSEFRDILGLYMQLRKEGVSFPQRDPNARYMIKFEGIESPIYQTIEDNNVYEEPTKQFERKQEVKDFISATTEVDHMSNADGRNKKPSYLGQDYEGVYNQQIGQLEAAFDGEEMIGDDEITMLRESCLLLDDIMTNAQTLDELRGEIALEVVENHEISLKKLKKMFKTKESAMTQDQKKKIGILYQTLKRQLRDFYDHVDEFKSNGGSRPSYFDYNKMKQKGIEDLKQWSDEQQIIVGDNKDEEEPEEPEEDQGEIDLLGMDDTPAPAPVQESQPEVPQSPEKNKFNLPPPPGMQKKEAPEVVQEPELDLLGFGMEEVPSSQQDPSTDNTDLFKLDLNLGNTKGIEDDDDDFFAQIAQNKTNLMNF